MPKLSNKEKRQVVRLIMKRGKFPRDEAIEIFKGLSQKKRNMLSSEVKLWGEVK
jgi:hypothetical protein